MYQPIDPVRTGEKLKKMLSAAGYDVKYIQKYLNLSCPQSIYRWFKGKILPSVEHLCALSELLNVHMEDLLVLQSRPALWVIELAVDSACSRIVSVHRCFRNVLMVA